MKFTQAELEQVAGRLVDSGARVSSPLWATPLSGGRSNLTFRLDDGESSWVLRMPPRHGRTPSAHDIGREHRMTAAVHGSDVPVARPVLYCDDEEVIGAVFAVAEFVDGVTVQTAVDLDALSDDAIDSATDSLVSTLAALHRLEPLEVGLGPFARRGSYAARQLATWSRQWAVVGVPKLGALAEVVRTRVEARLPAQEAVAIVHGDYRIDNTILDRGSSPRVLAVVDWELATIGDPVADVATMCAYRNPAFDLVVGEGGAWTSSRLRSPEDLAAGYLSAGGVPLHHWELHLALAHYKVAVIAAGIEHRRQSGSGSGVGFDTAAGAVAPYLEQALAIVRDIK